MILFYINFNKCLVIQQNAKISLKIISRGFKKRCIFYIDNLILISMKRKVLWHIKRFNKCSEFQQQKNTKIGL